MDITLAEHAGEQFAATDHEGCQMTVLFDCCESDEKVGIVALNFLLL